MNKAFLENIFANAGKSRIFIIGDVMLDRYLFGDVNRISPEAPVQVFDMKKSENRLGGAANVAFNVSTLGSIPFLIGVTGNDRDSELLREQLSSLGISTDGLIHEDERPTTSKTRVISDAHHLIRIDSESKEEISESSANKVIELLEGKSHKGDVVILQDYNKGVLSKTLIQRVIALSKKKDLRVLVDPKFENFFEYKGSYLFKPNRKELEDAMGKKVKDHNHIDILAEEVMNKVECENVILTLGEHGMLILERNGNSVTKEIIGTKARKVADVSGAGDTVISTIAVCLSGGSSLRDAAVISNYAAGLVVEEVGIVPVYKDALIANISGSD
jgi:rfaE bifunctional protein kinase chain/domain